MQIINAAEHEQSSKKNENPAQHHSSMGCDHEKEKKFSTNMPPEVPEVTVNGVLIEETSVLEEMQHHPAESKREAMVKTVEALIVGELLKQKAVELGLIESTVTSNSIEEAAGLKKLIQQEVIVPRATEKECLRFFEQNQSKFMTSPLIELRHILLAAAPDNINERHNLKEVADQLIAQLTETPSAFNDLVTRHSACPSKETQGSLGQISKGQTVPEFEKHIFAANEGLVSYPIESRYGFHITMIDRKIEGKALPYDYVKEKVADYLNDKVERKATAQYIQTLISEADIKGFVFNVESSPLIQ